MGLLLLITLCLSITVSSFHIHTPLVLIGRSINPSNKVLVSHGGNNKILILSESLDKNDEPAIDAVAMGGNNSPIKAFDREEDNKNRQEQGLNSVEIEEESKA